jgi:hypothetical protein
MKKSLIFTSLAAAFLALPSCSSDDPAVNTVPVDANGSTYVAVSIRDTNSGTRAASDYEDGTTDESAVANAGFYFYDADGSLVAEGKVWTGTGTATVSSTAANIQWTGTNVLQIDGLTDKSSPKYLVTVLNIPTGFSPQQKLADMKEALADAANISTNKDGKETNFMMATSTYNAASGETARTYNFVTELSESDFLTDPVTASNVTSPLDVYVERLAVKGTVTLDVASTNTTSTFANSVTAYKVFENTQVFKLDANGAIVSEACDVYVSLNNWAFNVTEKQSYVLKHLSDSYDEWTSTTNPWNVPTSFRSYWGESVNYSTTVDLNTDAAYATAASTDAAAKVVAGWTMAYKTYAEVAGTIGSDTPLYCTENTSPYSTSTAQFTSTLLAGSLYVVPTGQSANTSVTPATYIRFGRALYTEEAFKARVISEANLTYYKQNTENTNQYDVYTLKTTDLALQHIGDGKVIAKLATDVYKSLYVNSADKYQSATTDDETTANGVLQAASASGNTSAYCYTDGKLYYNVPIKHLNTVEVGEGEGEGTTHHAKQGYYGVVRNHVYKLVVKELTDIGHAVADVSAPIVPTKEDDPNTETYGIVTRLNILNWRVVNGNDMTLK